MVAPGGEQRTWGQLSAHTTLRLQLSGSVASLSLWGAGDSATGSMWQEVGTVTHRVAQHPPCGSWDVYGQRPQEDPEKADFAPSRSWRVEALGHSTWGFFLLSFLRVEGICPLSVSSAYSLWHPLATCRHVCGVGHS